jgi:methylmalonyl-CoA/ethylmalonyl-CoA epimerase
VDATFFHLGIAVRDLAEAKDRYGALHGVPRFGEVVDGRVAFGRGNGLYVELIQVDPAGAGAASRWMQQHGEGIFHVSYATDDVEQRPGGVDRSPEVTTLRPDGGLGIVYLDTLEQLGHYVELMHRSLADALRDWTDEMTAGSDQPWESPWAPRGQAGRV